MPLPLDGTGQMFGYGATLSAGEIGHKSSSVEEKVGINGNAARLWDAKYNLVCQGRTFSLLAMDYVRHLWDASCTITDDCCNKTVNLAIPALLKQVYRTSIEKVKMWSVE